MIRGKRSVIGQIVRINAAVSFVLLCVFTINYLQFDRRLRQEVDARSHQVLQTLTRTIDTESSRLSILMDSVTRDRSFVLALSNRLTQTEFVTYSREVSEKLLILQHSLPYASDVFAYVGNNTRMLFTNMVITKDEYFKMENQNRRLPDAVRQLDLAGLPDGFRLAGTECFYVANVRNYGAVFTMMDPERFCGLPSLREVMPEQEIAVLDAQGGVFALSSPYLRELLDGQKSVIENSRTVIWNGEAYRVVQADTRNGFHIILLGRESAFQQAQRMSSLIGLIAACVFLLGCGGLILFNARIYSPLQHIARRLVPEGKLRNEFDLISGKLDELTDENRQMQDRMNEQVDLQTDIELQYAILATREISASLAEHLGHQYGHYRVLVIALQNQTGGGGEQLAETDDYLADMLESKAIRVDAFQHAYLLPDTREEKEITGIVSAHLSAIKPSFQAFAGVSDPCRDVRDLHASFRQAQDRMLDAVIPWQGRYVVAGSETDTDSRPSAVVSLEVQNTLVRLVQSGTRKELEDVLQHLFFSDSDMTLREVMELNRQLIGLVSLLLSSTSTVAELTDIVSVKRPPSYHPAYIYHTLLEDLTRINAGCAASTAAMRYGIAEYLHRHYAEALSLDSISAVFGITPVYLSSWFKKKTGVNLSVYLSNIRMEEAMRILKEERNVKIADLAVRVGIPSAAAFTRQFRNHTGCTPDQYRHSLQQT